MVRKLDTEVSLVSGSIFSGGGVGDVGIEWGAKIPVLAGCELVPSRAALIRSNFPKTKVFEGDIWKLQDSYVEYFQSKLKGARPWLLTLSPPCQGMSSNGAGRISAAIRQGNRPEEDERNRLILPGINVLEQLQPDWFILDRHAWVRPGSLCCEGFATSFQAIPSRGDNFHFLSIKPIFNRRS